MSVEETLKYRLNQLDEMEEHHRETHKEFYNMIHDLKIEQANITAQYDSIMDSIKKMEEAVEELTAKPAKRWDTIIAAGITAVVSFVMAAVLSGTI